ncbi:hypothetical protein BH11ACT8_BH11ACT8_36130 [soil metagenome]
MTIDSGIDAPSGTTEPTVALRVVTTYDDHTRRVDIALTGSESVLVEEAAPGRGVTRFPTEQLWPVVRDLLPPLRQLTSAPRGRPATDPRRPGPTFVQDCRAFVALATVVDDQVSVRTWLATDDDLWSVQSQDDGSSDISLAPDGAVADLLVWDVTSALEHLVRQQELSAS